VTFELQAFSIWANNSQHSSLVEVTLQSNLPDSNDTDFDMVYLEGNLVLTVHVDEIYLAPIIFGGNVSSWSVTPEMPEGLDFNNSSGLISGIIGEEVETVVFTVVASNSLFLHSFDITITASLLDTDGDGVPDEFDPDDDGDGWLDVLEEECGTDPLDLLDYPADGDGDGVCNEFDDFDDVPILFFYPNDKISLTVGEEMEPLSPLVAPTSGDIYNFTVIPELPPGLSMNNTTGEISGVPTEAYEHLVLEYSHTFTAVNGQWEFSYSVDFDVVPVVDPDPDADGDGWSDRNELECNTNPEDRSEYPDDMDSDTICSYIDEDDDGDNIGDLIDAFPRDATAWDDTDNDSMPDEMTCKFLIDSANCTFELTEDIDDDGDMWNDTAEVACGTDPKDNLSVPLDDDSDGICNLLEEFVPPTVKILWICCFPLLLLLLLLLWLLNPFEVEEEEILNPEPEFTYTEDDWEGGTGEIDDPYLLRKVYGVRPGSFAESHEVIKVDNITPRLKCEFEDMNSEANANRFGMRAIKSNSRGEIEFALQFRDQPETKRTTTYDGLIRLGRSTVYFLWPVEVEVTKDLPEEEIAKRRAARIEREAKKKVAELEREAQKKADLLEREANQKAAQIAKKAKDNLQERTKGAEAEAKKAEEKAKEAKKKAKELENEAIALEVEREMRIAEEEEEAERLAAEEKAKRLAEIEERSNREQAAKNEEFEEKRKAKEAEKEKAKKKLKEKAEQRRIEEEEKKEAEERSRIEEAEKEAALEREVAEKEAALEREAAEKEAALEREAAEKEAALERESEKKRSEAKEKLRLKAEEAALAKKEKKSEEDVIRTEAIAIEETRERERDERRARLSELDEDSRRKEMALLRVSERSSGIDFGVIGTAQVTGSTSDVYEGSSYLEVEDSANFPDRGSAYLYHVEGYVPITWKGKSGNKLTEVSGIDRNVPAGARVTRKDDLKMINGLGPFIEEKLNALGIYTFEQIAKMTTEMEDEVNESIEFFPGRIKRDQWVNQAKLLIGSEDPSLADGKKTPEEMRRAGELVRKSEERKRAREASEMAEKQAMKAQEAEKLARKKARERAAKRAEEMRKEIEDRRAKLQDLSKKEREKEEALLRVAERSEGIDFGIIGFATKEEGDDLQKVSGIGPFIEEKLNALGIFKFSQIARMTPEMEDDVNQAIEFFIGRVKRDEWVKQAKLLTGNDW